MFKQNSVVGVESRNNELRSRLTKIHKTAAGDYLTPNPETTTIN